MIIEFVISNSKNFTFISGIIIEEIFQYLIIFSDLKIELYILCFINFMIYIFIYNVNIII